MRKLSELIHCRRSAIIAAVAAAMLLGIANSGISAETPAKQALGQSGFQGGLIVYLGDDRDTLAGLCGHGRESSLVLGLSTDSAWVASARQALKERGPYGPVSVDTLSGGRLPLVENLVNLLVVDTPDAVGEAELLRVLVPNGVALIGKPGGGYKKLTKPPADDTDDWTHYLYDATNNAVGHDKRVGPPRRVQWVGSPRWSRHHEQMSSMNALVSSGGRVFYVFDESPALSNQFAPQWKLIARDAFNGVPLWKRTIESWHNHRWPLKSGPAQLPRRLAAGDVTY